MGTFKVNQESVVEFFKKWLNGFNSDPRDLRDLNLYYFFKDEIYIKKEFLPDVNEVNEVVFTLSDRSRGADTELVNTYTYAIHPYDDVSVLLKLRDFTVTLAGK